MKKRLIVYCEGQTEETFVNRLLRNHLALHGVTVEAPVLAATSTAPEQQRGGFVNWTAIEADLKTLFARGSDPNLRFTTLFDVFRMPKAVLALGGFADRDHVSEVSDIEKLEDAVSRTFNEPRFKPYFQRQGFEALLLADTDALASVFHRSKPGIESLKNDISRFPCTEDINHGAATHPAARLANAIAGYENLKASNAYHVLAQTGFDTIRTRNPRFHAWLQHWENWGNAQPNALA